MADYIPQNKDELVTWGQGFVNYLQANLIDLGLTLPQIQPLIDAFTTYAAAVNAQTQALNQARAATTTMTAAMENFDREARATAQRIQVSPAVSNSEREAMGLPVRDKKRTRIAAPTTRPTVFIGIGNRLRHVINFRDEAAPNRRRKPDGIRECVIYFKISEQEPVSEDDYNYLAGASKTPHIADFDQADAGKSVWYLLRWKSTRGELGPPSLRVGARIPG